MGEAKNKRSRMTEQEIIAQAVTRRLADEGKLAEAGWVAYEALMAPKNLTPLMREEMRHAFLAGAHHVFFSFIAMLDDCEEETEADLRKMDLLHKELEEIGKVLSLKAEKPKGSA